MANRFAQFVKPLTSEAPAAAPANDTTTYGLPAAVKPNRFEQFVQKPAQPEAPAEDLAGQFGAGVATGIPNALTGLIDASERGRRMGVNIPGGDVIAGMIEPAIRPLVRKPTEYDAALEPKSGETLQKGLSAVRLNPNDYFAEPTTAGERVARMGGEGLVTALMPSGMGQAQGWAKLGIIAKELLAGTAGGAAAQGAMEVAPDELKPAAGLVGGLAGGIGGALVGEVPGVVKRAAGAGKEYLRPAVPTKGNVERMAGSRLAEASSDPAAAARALENVEEIVPGSKPTAFQATGDVGLGSMERAMARGDDAFKNKLLGRIEEQNAARIAALDEIEATGDVGAAAQFFRDRMAQLEERANTLYDEAEQRAASEAEGLGERPAGEVGEQARGALSAEFKRLNAEANKLWESIDPDQSMSVVTRPLIEATAKIYGEMSPEAMLSLSADEKAIASIIGTYGDVLPFQRFKELRTQLNEEMRKAKMTGQGRAYGRLSQLRGAVENAVQDSIEGKFAADSSLADDFVRQAKEWYAARTAPSETGAGAPSGAVASADQGPTGFAGPSGAERPAIRIPPASTRGAGLPEDARGARLDDLGAELNRRAARPLADEAPPEPVATPASEPPPRAVPRETAKPAGGIAALNPDEIGVDARRFQFKEGGDEQGVTDRLQGIEQWDERLAGTGLVFRDAEGRDFVADGHQRLGLAKRLRAEGHPPINFNAFVLDAADGFTDADARAIAAVKNIAEGTGTAVDAAKVLRAAKESGVDLPPLPPRSTLVRDGKALAELSPDAFGMVINEVVPAAQGAIVGRLVKDAAAQEEAVRLLAALKPDNVRQAEMVVRDMLTSGTEKGTRQGGLFGEEAFASSVVLERAKIADQALKLLKQDKKLFGTLVDEAERIEGAGNALNRDANATRLSTDEKAADLLTQLAFRAGPVSTELTRIARRLKAGDQTAHAAARDFLGTLRGAIEGGVDEGDGAGGALARGEVDEGVTPRDPDTQDMFQRAKPAPWRPGEKLGEFDTEPGLEGLPQALIPGVAPVDDAAKMRAASSKPLKGGEAPPPRGGLFDDDSREFADKQGSLFQTGAKKYPIAPRDEWYGEANFKDAGGKMTEMSPDEFLARAKPLKMDEVTRDNIDDLKRHIEAGRTLDPLKFFAGGKEDGRHRAMAAKELGIKSVPVIEFGDQIGRGARALNQTGEGSSIRDTMADRFAAAGRPAEEAVAAAEVVDAFYSTMAERLGVSVDELAKKYPLPKVQKGGDQGTLFQPAWHGTPHIFDKFDSSKIGTGEGNQSFGDGHYLAGRKEVGEHYRDEVGRQHSAITVDGKAMSVPREGRRLAELNAEERAISWARMALDQDETIASMALRIRMAARLARAEPGQLTSFQREGGWGQADVLDKAADILDGWADKDVKKGGRLYKVDVPDDDELLAWDVPLSEQPQGIQDKLAALGVEARPIPPLESIKSPTLRHLVRDALKASDGDPDQVGLVIDNDQAMYNRANEIVERVGRTLDEAALDDARGAPGEFIAQQASEYLSAIRDARMQTGQDIYNRLAQQDGPAAASAKLREAGIPGHRFLDQMSRSGDGDSYNYVIYDDSRINITDFEQPIRGSIRFGDDETVMSLFDAADASTAVHEGAHHFLQMFRSMADAPDAPASIVKDWQAARAWWDKNANAVAKDGAGITAKDVRTVLRDGTTGDRMKDLEVNRGLHEQWARGFELFLREGKAPNAAMRGIFQQFKDWLTAIYRRAEDLKVDLSPEIRDVFNRMLSTEKASATPKMLDEAAAGRFKAASAATRNIKETFGAKPVASIMRRPGNTLPFTMTPENVTNNIWRAGPEGAASIKSVMKAAGNAADAKEAIEAAAVLSLKRSAMKEGAVDPAKFASWRAKHSDALREVPDLEKRMSSAAAATKAMEEIGAKRKKALDLVQRTAIGKLLKVSDDADIPRTIGSMLGRTGAVKAMRELASEARKDQQAMAGLQRATVEYLMSRFKTPKEQLSAAAFQKFVGQNTPALSQILDPEQINALHAIARDVKRATKDVRAPGGGSDTKENFAAAGRYGITKESIMGTILRRALLSAPIAAAGHIIAGPLYGALSGVGGFLGGTAIQALRERGIHQVDDLVREAMLDPELMKALLQKAPKRPNKGSALTLSQRLGQIAVRDMLVNAGGEDRWQHRRTLPKKEARGPSPMLGVRG